MKPRLRLGSLVLLAFVLAACATTGSGRATRNPGHVSCLLDPSERGTRPLILFFCFQNP